MKPAHRKFILKQLQQHDIMSIATVRADGYPQTAFVKVTPKVISVLDYSKGFGHTDLVRP
jgi:hypothetical protein